MEQDFWQKKTLAEMSPEESEAVCDGCGLCCFRTYIMGHGKKARLYRTRIACDFLDLRTFRCTVYGRRFSVNPECTHITGRSVARCTWLPPTCAYRLLHARRPLPAWHPLVTGTPESVRAAGICQGDAVHERDAADWERYVVGTSPWP